MTREEAINTLGNFKRYISGGGVTDLKANEAIDMAIEALKNKSRPFGDCSKCIYTYGTLGCCTTVSNEWVYDCEHGMEQYKSTKAEPQKKYPTEWCEQCTLWEDNKCLGVAHCKSNIEALKHAMSEDLISRTEAIEAIEIINWYHQNKNKDMVRGANSDERQAWYKADDVYKALEAVPSADRPKGEWIESREQNILMAKRIEKGETWRVCSNCGTGFMIGAQYEGQKCYGKRFHNFCPRCGADMRSE